MLRHCSNLWGFSTVLKQVQNNPVTKEVNMASSRVCHRLRRKGTLIFSKTSKQGYKKRLPAQYIFLRTNDNQELLTYDEVVKEMIIAEAKYIRDLNMIIKVFRAPFVEAKDLFTKEDIDKVFSNITDIYDFSVSFYGLLEAAIEVADEGKSPAIGTCFEDMAEGNEFEVYEKFAKEQMESTSKMYRHLGIGGKLYELLARPKVAEYFRSKGSRFKETVQYCLPKLLMIPLQHCMHYFDLIKLLKKTSPDEFDLESLEQVQSSQSLFQANMERIIGNMLKKKEDKFSKAQKRKSGILKSAASVMNELQRNIDGWEGKDISQTCTEILKEGVLGKLHPNKKYTERYVFLLDGLLICCKQNTRHSLSGQNSPEYRLKEKYFLRKAEINDLDDTEDVKNAFEVVERDQLKALFICKNETEKNEWMAMLMTLHMRSTLDRLLDHMLLEEEKAIPLRIPNPDEYCFAVEDAEDNIVFEEGQGNSVAPVIRGGTLIKLIERLTHHKYADPTFVRTFLTTYRSFCKPRELLDLLIDRFKIPEPPPSEEDRQAMARGQPVLREDLKRFRKEYAQPVQLRVLNAIRHWVDQHFYDFERDKQLLKKLEIFLSEVNGKAMRRWVESINKVISRKSSLSENSAPEITFEKDPPPIEWHLSRDIDKFDILTLHPIEIARHLTIIESELYRAVKPSELVGSVWTKEDQKHITSPNLLKMIHHTNNITLWFEKSLCEMANLEERVAVLRRIIDILSVFQELNNFNGILEVVSALNSSPIYRLQHTFAELSTKRQQILDEAKELTSDHYKKYIEKLRSINPPCVPFFGMYMSNILKIEDGNPDFLPNYPEGIINFSKRRKVAEITGEIQQYQNQPYCLASDMNIKEYLENLDPLEGRDEKEMADYLYKLSLEIEPRNSKQALKFPRVTEIPLKSPGTKPSFLLSRLSISSQSTLNKRTVSTSSIFNADYGEASTPTSTSTFHLSRPALSPNTFTPSNSTPLIPESLLDEHDPDYENIEHFASQEEAAAPPLPPLLPPRPAKQRTVSVVEDRPLPEVTPIKRINSMPLVNCNIGELKESPEFPHKPIRMPIRPPPPPPPEEIKAEAPPLPPRHPLRSPSSSSNGPPPLPPRSSQVIDPAIVIDDDLKPPALPPKSKKS
ncbi:son of sevenless homolog 1-like isoform X2 [Actinia tenebrosa]|uniref:Son of sevenless homolog 1-like isoform X2 n=1 Tax=Actinia tenebrosa TaxID=6105 RepID=A0A6P8ILS4_ACTTE|nr:son of sevenless homolog 1-like isoform X2 [Actinia tenebrosa]